MIRALFGAATVPHTLRRGLDETMEAHRQIAKRVAGAWNASTQAASDGTAAGTGATAPDVATEMAALADTQLRYEAEAKLLQAAYQNLRRAIHTNG